MHKLEEGNPLVLLCVEILFTPQGAQYWPAPEKVEKWLRTIDHALKTDELQPGEASRLTGRLQWGTQHAFRRLGRAMLRALIEHSKQRSSVIGPQLRKALCWWRDANNRRQWMLQRGLLSKHLC